MPFGARIVRRTLIALVCMAIASVAAPSTAAAETTPTLDVTPRCDAGEFGFVARVGGLPPGAQFIGGFEGLTTTGGTEVSSATFTALADGTFVFAASLPGRFFERITFFVLFEGTRVEQTLERPCLGPRLPTTKDQCKNGGWRSFDAFKNQGDCVSFVARSESAPQPA